MSAPFDVGSSGKLGETGEEILSHEFIRPTISYQPPVPFDPNQHFQFNTSERCERSLGWSNWSTSDISFETPSSFDSAFTNISFRVRNYTTETWATTGIADSREKKINFAQGFNITQNATMSGFSIYVLGSAETTITLSIREETPGGPILYNFPVTIPNLGNDYWYNVTLNASDCLTAGHYYLYYPRIGSSTYCRWYHTGTGAFGDAYANEGEANYNMTLKVHTKNFVDPESVNLNVSNQPVRNILNGTGWANLTAQILGSTLKSFSVSYSTPIEYAYSSYMICNRNSNTQNAVSLTTGYANWTLTGFSYPGSNYTVYQGNITGFNENYRYIQAFSGESHVGFNQSESSDTLIFKNPVDRITFESPNYITGVDTPSEVHSNQDVDLNVTAGDLGNVSVTIFSGAGSVYENKRYAGGTAGFLWHVETALAAGEYTFEATFFNPNNVGFFRQNITLVKVAAIDTYNLNVKVLDVMRLNFRLFEQYGGGTYIPDAVMNYYFTDLSGSLQYDSIITHNYTKDINLETYSIRPGPYTLFLEALKPGYQSILVSIPVEIMKRAMDIEVTRSATNILPGNTLEIGVTPRDLLTGGNLLRPANITIYIYPAGGNPDADAVANETIYSTTTLETQSLVIPPTAAIGAYDILIRIQSDFYMGSKFISNGLIIDEPLNAWLSTLVVVGIGMVGSVMYVQRKKVQTRRSVKGAFIMNPGGTLIEQRISDDFSTMNPNLISGAVMGIVTMVKEMTGGQIHTIALEGRYLKFVIRDSFWVVLIMQKNPAWISGTILRLVDEIEQKYGIEIKAWKGDGNLHIPFDDMLRHWFGVEIKAARDPALELESREMAESRAIESASDPSEDTKKKE